jgi:hypothetical protein
MEKDGAEVASLSILTIIKFLDGLEPNKFFILVTINGASSHLICILGASLTTQEIAGNAFHIWDRGL